MAQFSHTSQTSQNIRKCRENISAKRFLMGVKNATVAMALAHSSVQSDELTLPVGVSIIHANAEQSNLIRQNAQMCHEL